ncbi:hypothetical protein EC968_007563 [Mortierella alpina]|nr:hypothetical protein EC968_007563 [Mortierella alpina]
MTNSRRVAIVTGASRGIGRAPEGSGRIASLQDFSPSNNQEHVRAIAVQGDSGKTANSKRILDDTIAAFGHLDVMVLNAAWVNLGTVEK